MSLLSFFEIGFPCAAYAGLELMAVCLRLFWVLGFQAVLYSGSFPFSSVSLLPTTGWTGLLHHLLSHDAPRCHSPNLTRKSDSGWQPGELPYQALPLEVVYLGYSVSAKQTYAFKSYLTWELFFFFTTFICCVCMGTAHATCTCGGQRGQLWQSGLSYLDTWGSNSGYWAWWHAPCWPPPALW